MEESRIREKEEEKLSNWKFKFSFYLEANDKGKREVYNKFLAFMNSQNWAFGSLNVSIKYINS